MISIAAPFAAVAVLCAVLTVLFTRFWCDRVHATVLREIDDIRKLQEKIMSNLEGHIKADIKRQEDMRLAMIMQFDAEILNGWKHTMSQYDEVLDEIERHRSYIDANNIYDNAHAVAAIANIKNTYTECMENNAFLKGVFPK